MMRENVREFFSYILAVCMIGIELIVVTIGAPVIGAIPILVVEDGAILLIPFATAVTAVLFLYVLNLWFAVGFMNVIANIRAGRRLIKKYEEIDPVEST